MTQPTIYALSTVYGKSGVAVIRISGTAALQVVAALTELDVGKIKLYAARRQAKVWIRP